jgi:two-component system sensor histidine kinase SenX3
MWSRTSARAGGRGQPQEAPDVTEAEPLEATMPLSARLQSALEGIEQAIVVCDADGQTVFQNSAAERLFSGRPSEALIAQTVSEVIGEALADGRPERRLDLISPARRSLSIRAFPTGAPTVDGAVAVVEDISERLRLEAVRRDFVANVSHELKTPTGALILLAETVEDETDPEVITRLVRRMGGEAERLSRIIDDLLDLSRIEANEAPSGALVPVRDFVGEAVGSLQAVAAGMDVTVQVGDLSLGVAVSGDRRDLISAVANLVDNAV